MANYTPSNLVAAQAVLVGKFGDSERRYADAPVWMEFLRQSEIMIPGYMGLRTREDRVVTTYFKNRTSRALGTGRSHNHTGAKGDTTAFTPAWTTYNDDFSISLKQAGNNVLSEQEMFNNEIENAVINFFEGLETLATNYVFNNRSGVNVSTSGEGTFDATDDVYQITETTNGDRAVQITKSVMRENKYKGNKVFICDTISYNKFEKDANQGTGNSTNLSFQYSGVRFINALELGALAGALVGAYAKGFWIAMDEGVLSALPWIPKENRMGISTRLQTYASIINPLDGLTYAIHSYETAQDGTATNGYTQDELTQYEISIDVALSDAPLTTANETTLQAFAFV